MDSISLPYIVSLLMGGYWRILAAGSLCSKTLKNGKCNVFVYIYFLKLFLDFTDGYIFGDQSYGLVFSSQLHDLTKVLSEKELEGFGFSLVRKVRNISSHPKIESSFL